MAFNELTFKSDEIVSHINDSVSLNFEFLKYNPSDNNEVILLDEACDSGSNFYNANVQTLDTPYISLEELPSLRINIKQNYFSILHLNIRNIKIFLKNFKLFLSSLKFNFIVIYFSET